MKSLILIFCLLFCSVVVAENTGIWKGTCVKCGAVSTHRGTEPTQTKCSKTKCNGTIIWQKTK